MRRAVYEVVVAGQNISSRLAPLLTSLEVSDQEGTHSDTARITIDDRDAAVRFPKTGDTMTVSLGWEGEGLSVVFEGTVDEARSSGSRGGGRELMISAKGVDTIGKAKEPQQLHVDNASVKEALEKAGKAAGVTSIKVDPSFESIRRPWWGLNDESFLHFGERVAREIGGIFKLKGAEAIIAAKGGGSVSGGELPSVTARWGDNLISWDITPSIGRPRHKEVRARWYDTKEAKWKEAKAEVQDEGAKATLAGRYSRADEDEAKGVSKNHAKEIERQKGGGSISIDGTAKARPGGSCVLAGARPGADGTYRVKSVDHSYSRGGWTTKLEVEQPQGDAGTDTRSGGQTSGNAN